jgi:hypothetical protein
LVFWDRFLRDKPQSAEEVRHLRSLVETSFDLGLLYHLILNNFPTRTQAHGVNLDTLFERWAPESIAADSLSRAYDRGNQGIPSSLQKAFAERQVEPFLKNTLRIGFWRRAKALSWFRNAFFAGTRLGLHLDLATKAVANAP